MIFRSIVFYLFNIFLVVWLESFLAKQSLWLPLSAVYVFYLTVGRGIYQSLIISAVLSILVSALCGYNNFLMSLLAFSVAYFWRDMGNCQRFIPQILPVAIFLLPSYILMFGLDLGWFNSRVLIPSFLTSVLSAPLFLWFWDYLSDSCQLPRFSVLDNYVEDSI